jgi:ribosomal protein S18 acetylase RimI-like enzyme
LTVDINSLGYRSDLIFPRFDGQIMDRGDYLAVLTPANPDFHWGNFLLFKEPPGEGDFNGWKALFSKEIGLEAQHMAFGWDTVDGEMGQVGPFLAAGFSLEESVVLTAASVNPPPKVNHEVVVRPLSEDWEWEAALGNQIACRDLEYGEAGYRVFRERQMARYRKMVRAGLGHWFGAFLEGRLVADLGVFKDDELGRFQSVGTHLDFRRRGICGTLVYRAASHAYEAMGISTLVMVADEHDHAAGIYESVGFEKAEYQRGLGWWDRARGSGATLC